MLQRAKPCFDNEVAAILARLRRSRIALGQLLARPRQHHRSQ
jgi:hypothetical protein